MYSWIIKMRNHSTIATAILCFLLWVVGIGWKLLLTLNIKY